MQFAMQILHGNNNLQENLETSIENELGSRSLEDLNGSARSTRFKLSKCLKLFSLANLLLFKEKTRKKMHSNDLAGRHETGKKTKDCERPEKLSSFKVRQGAKSDKSSDKLNDRAE